MILPYGANGFLAPIRGAPVPAAEPQAPLMEFGEVVLMREAGERKHKLAILWDEGCWLGRSTDTGNHIVGGATRC